MSKLIPSNQLPPSPWRDPNGLNLSERRIDNVARLGISGDVLKVVKRGDALTDPSSDIRSDLPMSEDGVLSLAEFERFQKPKNQAVLFPPELAALPQAQKLFEVPTQALRPTFTPVPTLQYRLTRTEVSAGVSTLVIANLPAADQEAARRLQLVRNSDNDPATLSRDDITWAFEPANSGAFTNETLATFRSIRQRLPEPQYVETITGVVPPAVQTQPMLSSNGVTVSRFTHMSYPGRWVADRTVRRTEVKWPNPPRAINVTEHELVLSPALRTVGIDVQVPAGLRVFAKLADSYVPQEWVVEGGTHQLSFYNAVGGQLLIQIYDAAGNQVDAQRIEMPQPELEPMAIPAHKREVNAWVDTAGKRFDPSHIAEYGFLPHRDAFLTSYP